MQAEFFNVDEFCENLPEITTNKLYSRKDFHPKGLFSQVIFGPIKNYTCGCGIYYGRSKLGTKCKVCDVVITHSSERRKRFAKVKLPFAIMNPIMYYIVCKLGKTSLKDIIHDLLISESVVGYWFDTDKDKFVKITEDSVKETPIPEGRYVFSGIEGAFEIIKLLATKRSDSHPLWKFVNDNIDKFYMSNVIVLPPAFRPTSKSRDAQKRDQLNDFYLTILNISLSIKERLIDLKRDDKFYTDNIKHVQKYVFEMYDFILSKFSKKTGIIRESILGKRNDFSARGVISPDPELKLEECKLPYTMLLELYKMDISNALLEKRKFRTFQKAIVYVDECIVRESYDLFDLVNEVCKGKYIMLNRQPTLHRMGFLSFKIKEANKESVIQIHPMACEPFNADFDGDTMAVYRPLYEIAEKECAEKLSIVHNLLSPTTGDMIVGINQDIVLGVYLATLEGATPDVDIALVQNKDNRKTVEKINDSNKARACGPLIKTSEGRFLFYKCLPEIYQTSFAKLPELFNSMFNKPLTRNHIVRMLNDVTRQFPALVAECLDKIKDLGLRQTTIRGTTMSLKQMKVAEADKIVSSILDDVKLSVGEKVAKLKSDDIMAILKANFSYSSFIDSGSRGSWDQARQIILTRGFVSNSQGEIISEPIRNNLINGFTRREYFNSSYGTRKGLLDTALNTGVSGYLTRKTVYSTANLELDYNNEDCGTTDNLKVEVYDIKMARALVGRYYFDEKGVLQEITLANYFKLINQHLRLRSPVYCKSNKICKVCYGKNSEVARSKYVGIIASQALGEIGTQLVMRTFHTAGVAQDVTSAEGEKDQQKDIVDDLTRVRSMLHCSGIDKVGYEILPLELYKVYSKHRNVMLVHFECVVSQMMRVGNDRWRILPNRNDIEPQLVSILSVPQKESWLLALAFYKPKDYLIDGIVRNSSTDGVLERIMTNRKI